VVLTIWLAVLAFLRLITVDLWGWFWAQWRWLWSAAGLAIGWFAARGYDWIIAHL
jgi:membrane-associated protease RseP (regulator of RpoE activity)